MLLGSTRSVAREPVRHPPGITTENDGGRGIEEAVEDRRRRSAQGGGGPAEPFRRGASIAERYPAVEALEFRLSFVPPSGDTITLTRVWNPSHSALFHFGCRNERCVGGGFDLNPAVHAMLRTREHRTEGTLVCGGAVRGRLGESSPCGHELRFVAWADYRTP
jgi:hypothetical protein